MDCWALKALNHLRLGQRPREKLFPKNTSAESANQRGIVTTRAEVLTATAELGRELSVDRDEGIFAAILRPVIAHETSPGANDNVPLRAVAKNQHGADRCGKLVPDREPLETVATHELVAGL